MSQLTIDFARARASDPMTSVTTAIQSSRFAESHAGRILAALKLHGPMTAHELGIVGLTVVQADRRLPELASKRLVSVVKTNDGVDLVRGGCRVWGAV
jgi:predicted ArsR family transcriptional regulator